MIDVIHDLLVLFCIIALMSVGVVAIIKAFLDA